MEGHKQVDPKASTSNSGLCRVSPRVGISISRPSADAGANGSRKDLVISRETKKPVYLRVESTGLSD